MCPRGAPLSFPSVERIPVDGDGVVDLAWLQRRLAEAVARARCRVDAGGSCRRPTTRPGVLQPLAAIAGVLAAAQATWVCDAVQAAGRIVLDLTRPWSRRALPLRPQARRSWLGVGAVVFASDALVPEPLLRVAAARTRRQRLGHAENIAAIAGLLRPRSRRPYLNKTRSPRSAGICSGASSFGLRSLSSDVVIFSEAVPRLANHDLLRGCRELPPRRR